MITLEEIIANGNYTLVDVREAMELEMDGAFDQALNIPLGEMEERKDEVLNLEGTVILFCKSGNRSGRALEFLEQHGLKSGYNGGGFIQLHALIESL